MRLFLITFCFVIFINSTVYAHSGRTDSSGCHNDTLHNSYHCHGQPNNTFQKNKYNTSTNDIRLHEDKEETSTIISVIMFFTFAVIGVYLISGVLYNIYYSFKNFSNEETKKANMTPPIEIKIKKDVISYKCDFCKNGELFKYDTFVEKIGFNGKYDVLRNWNKYKCSNCNIEITMKECIECKKEKDKEDFFDKKLKTKYGNKCNECKASKSKKKSSK